MSTLKGIVKDTVSTVIRMLPAPRNCAVILAYHSIGDDGTIFSITPKKFEEHMRWLKEKKFNVVSLSQLAAYRKAGSIPRNTVAITFDDGYRDNYTHALPILERYHFPATVFVITGKIGAQWKLGKTALPLMNEEELRAIHASGLVDIQAHTVTHPRLPKIPTADAAAELAESKQVIERMFGPCEHIAYPHGAYSQSVRAAVVAAGFTYAYTIGPGRATPECDDMLLPRKEVVAATTFAQFKAIARFGHIDFPFVRSALLLGAILLGAFLIRLSAVSYGLPFHVIGDEETNVYGALLMLNLHTVLPVFHQSSFTILYEPPLLAYVYTLLFIPTLAVAYVAMHLPGLHAFMALITLDPSVLWYVARTFVVLCSIASIVVVYKLGRAFFKNEVPALLGALFFATSFLSTAIASNARHWTPGTLCSLLAVLCTYQAFNGRPNTRVRFLFAAGAALGCSFGFSYLTWYMPLIAAIIVYFSYTKASVMQSIRDACINGFLVGAPLLLLAGLFVLVDPYPFYIQVIHHVNLASQRSFQPLFSYYARVLWNFETPLCIGSAIGLCMLLVRKDILLFISLVLFLVTAAVPMYFFMGPIARYLVAIIPVLALLSAYGVWHLSARLGLRNVRIGVAIIVIILLAYAGAVFGRYEVLLLRGDTRVQAYDWIEANIPAGSTVIDDSEGLRLSGTVVSLAMQNQLAPESLRANDRVLLQDGQYATHPFALVTLHTITATSTKELLIQQALARSTGPVYVIEDAWTAPEDALLPRKTLVKEFTGSSGMGQTGLFTDSDYTSKQFHVLALLYGSPSFGPDVSVYVLDYNPGVR
jgi:peptidoglycan/xylan/chitin deacetylase (PgdA/CDA1 family)